MPALLAVFVDAALASKAPAHTQTRTGVVSRVVDGDTLWVKTQSSSKPLKVRLLGIDAPEICQSGGAASREALRQRVIGRTVAISFRRHDDYGRTLAGVHLEGEDMGRWMVSQGQAWSYRYRRDPGPYAAEQAQAQLSGRGLFSDPDAENPRSFRKRHGSCYLR